jgi:formylmethanofuran dehydrogenase subunit E
MSIDEATLQRAVEFHGHLCPGLTMGLQAAQLALREVGAHGEHGEVIAVTETDMCGVDGIQVLTGCTFGKGNLIHHDYGKNAFSFYRLSDERAVRVVGRPGGFARDAEHVALMAKVRGGDATDAERARFRELHQERAMAVLEQDPDELFEVHQVDGPAPRRSRDHASVECPGCGETTRLARTRRLDEADLCVPCFDRAAERQPAAVSP